MSIKPLTVYQSTDGKIHTTQEEAVDHERINLLRELMRGVVDPAELESVVGAVFDLRETLVKLLTADLRPSKTPERLTMPSADDSVITDDEFAAGVNG